MPRKVVKTKRNTQRKVKRKSPFRWLKRVVLLLFLVACGFLISYLGYLDHTVRKTFKGKPWSIPAKVYASPLEVYGGYNISANQFEKTLQQLNYRQDYQLSFEGSYFKKGSRISLKTRKFTFWDKEQESRLLRIRFSDNKVGEILDLTASKVVPIVRMDPLQIGSFYPTRKEDRILITLDKSPQALTDALLATEDRDFYGHFGISLKAIARAMWVNMRAGAFVQGGSTITQQLIKNFYLSPEKSLWRKINEALMAIVLEVNYEKDEILQAYLNEIYLGQDGANSIHGFGLASQFYFGRPLESLPLENIAALVALVRGPSYYDLRRHNDRATKRRNLVLDEMEAQGFIKHNEAAAAKRKKLVVISRPNRPTNRYPGFLDLVRRQLSKEYREDDLTSEGLKVFTTLDARVQNTLEETIQRKLKQLEKRPKSKKLETAVIVTRREGGEIVALASGRDPKSVGFNRALDAVRPIGSLMKPAVYLTALEYPERYTIITPLSDVAISIKDKTGKAWKPKNYDRKEHGDVPLHRALAKSYNLATVSMGMDIGVARIAKTVRNLGVDRTLKLYPSLLLGASSLTPLEVTQMYQTLADDGFSTPLRSIRAVVALDGERLQSYPYTVRQTVDPSATYLTNVILQEVMHHGTGRSAYKYLPDDFGLVGKTGTTNGLKDSWFAGYSGDYLSVAWIGRDDNKSAGLTGSTGALQVWSSLMKQISTQPVYLIPPDNIEEYWIDPETGLIAKEECEGAVLYPFVRGSAPNQDSPCLETVIDRTETWFNDFFQDGLY